MNTRVYPKGSWNVRINATIEDFVDTWMTVVKNGGTYTTVAKVLGCEVIDVQYAEARIKKQGVNLPSLNITDQNDDRVVIIV